MKIYLVEYWFGSGGVVDPAHTEAVFESEQDAKAFVEGQYTPTWERHSDEEGHPLLLSRRPDCGRTYRVREVEVQ